MKTLLPRFLPGLTMAALLFAAGAARADTVLTFDPAAPGDPIDGDEIFQETPGSYAGENLANLQYYGDNVMGPLEDLAFPNGTAGDSFAYGTAGGITPAGTYTPNLTVDYGAGAALTDDTASDVNGDLRNVIYGSGGANGSNATVLTWTAAAGSAAVLHSFDAAVFPGFGSALNVPWRVRVGANNALFSSGTLTIADSLATHVHAVLTNAAGAYPTGAVVRLEIDAPNVESANNGWVSYDNFQFAEVSAPDNDGDGWPDFGDNCPAVSNPGQQDADGDLVGDACDNCPGAYNPTQADWNQDGAGDACDDSDGDGIVDEQDNCLSTPNAGQQNSDGDALGDACDNCPFVFNTDQEDTDEDGVGNACDNCPEAANPSQTDADFDGIGTLCDNCPSAFNASQADWDGDGRGDACEDSDQDGHTDEVDNCRTVYNPSQVESDGDGVADGCDNCPTVANPGQEDLDWDGSGDACDATISPALLSYRFGPAAASDLAIAGSYGAVVGLVRVRHGVLSNDMTSVYAGGAMRAYFGHPDNYSGLTNSHSAVVVTGDTNDSEHVYGRVVIAPAGAQQVRLESLDLGAYRVGGGTGATNDADSRLVIRDGAGAVLFSNDISVAASAPYHFGTPLTGAAGSAIEILFLDPAGKRVAIDNIAFQVLGAVSSNSPVPLHRYAFASDARDSVGGAHGTLVGSAVVAGGQLDLTANNGETSGNPGGGGYVDLPNRIISTLGNQATIEVWVTVSQERGWQRIFEFGNSTGGEGVSSEGAGYRLMLTSGSGAGNVETHWDSGNFVGLVRPGALTVSNEHHLVMVIDESSCALFVNGAQVDADGTPLYGLTAVADVNNWLGRSLWQWDPLFDGLINELRIYDTALTPYQIAGNYAAGPDVVTGLQIASFSAAPSGVVLDWESVPGQTYLVRASTDLGGSVWTDVVTNLVATSTKTSYTNQQALKGQEFFRVAQAGAPSTPPPPLPDPYPLQTFESGAAGWTATNPGGTVTEWELGLPNHPAGNHTNAFSGTNAWGTALNDAYLVGTTNVLISPPINFTGYNLARVTWRQQRGLDPGDVGLVNVVNDQMTVTLAAVTGNTTSSGAWETAFGIIPPSMMGRTNRLEFVFQDNGTNNGGYYGGWYIDDVVVTSP